ncbi:chemotaxis-specific protein-glutamate methyltransferase CheB [Falsiroseomonas sp. CW058]|uniref:chemotaxis-specific protein-glutamate methyltransferase CheB n=1 Tax=Falsiroseomonas sp. CW058 TaxID=3388664 RepID=UPI003D31DE68
MSFSTTAAARTATATGAPVRVMICDDSALARSAIGRLLGADAGLRLVAQAKNGREALDLLAAMPAAERPQVVLLDLEMPVMDGMTALPLILKAHPGLAVIVASALSQRGAAATMQALAAGAVDYVPKPSAASGGIADPRFREDLIAKVKGWARMRRGGAAPAPAFAPRAPAAPLRLVGGRPRLVALGSSTGGPQALAALVAKLDRPLAAPVVAVQHMPAGFTGMLAEHLGRQGRLRCAEARDGEPLLPGRFYLAPGDRHLLVKETPAGLLAQLSDAPPENFCRPAVDPMLRSVAATCGGRAVVAILTGMGQDGLAGCRELAKAGALVLAQDEASSVVWGMPGAVAKAGIAAAVVPVEEIAARITAAAAEGSR